QILLRRPDVGKRLSPQLRADLPLRRDGPGRQTALDYDQGRVWSKLLQPEGRFPLANLDVRFWELMVVNVNVRSRKIGAVGVDAIAVLELALNLEVEVLGKIAGQIDARPAQTKTVFQRGLTKATFEGGDLSVFQVHLNVSAKHEFEFRCARSDVNLGLLFHSYAFFNVRFPVVSHHCLPFARRPSFRSALLLQTTDFLFQLRVSFLQLLHCTLELLQSLGLGVAAGGLGPQRLNYQQQQRKGDPDPN